LNVISGDLKITSGSLSVGGNFPNSAIAGRIDATNDVVAFSTSDERLKEDIQLISNPIEKLTKINGVNFKWKDEFNKIHGYEGLDVGVIAQEIEAIIPEAIRHNETGYLAVRYEKIIPLLIECVKQLNKEIEILKNK
jgi:hypothetical protein